MKFKRNLITVLAAALIAAATPSVSASAYSSVVDHNSRFDEGIPQPIKTERMKIAEWDGRTSLKADTCYFVDRDITVGRKVTLPESSMLVVKNAACLKIADNGKLLAKGTVAVHSDSKLNIRSGGSLIVKSTSVFVNNGTLAVSKGGYAGVYGYVQSTGAVNLKGRLYILNNGQMTTTSGVNIKSSSAALKGEPQNASGEAHPEYMVYELPQPENTTLTLGSMRSGDSAEVTDENDREQLARGFESVLYKYSGELDMPDKYFPEEYLMQLQFQLSACLFSKDTGELLRSFGVTRWNGVFTNTYFGDDDVRGYCYSVVKGMPDEELFCQLLDKYSGQDAE